MSVRGLDHVSVTTADLDRSLAFYCDLLGLRVRDRGESGGEQMAAIVGFPSVRFRYADVELGGGQILELLQYLEPEGRPLDQRTSDPGSGHIALAVDDIDRLYRRLVEAGVTVRSAPITIGVEGDGDVPETGGSGIRVTYAPDAAETGIGGSTGTTGVRVSRGTATDRIEIEEPGDWVGVRVLYAVDPDGVTVELVQRPEVV